MSGIYLGQKTANDEDEDDEGGDHSSAHASRVVEHLTSTRQIKHRELQTLHQTNNPNYASFQEKEEQSWLKFLIKGIADSNNHL